MKHPRDLHLKLPRSEVVQNLSILTGFLDWVRPLAGNYHICGRMRQIIKKILDQILDPPSGTEPPETPAFGSVDFEADFGMFENLDDLDWLNSVDWTRGPLMDFG